MPRASVHTLGCRLNQAESALLSDAFRSRGYRMVSESEPADLIVINSCSVTRGAEAKCRRLVRCLLKRSPSAHVIVTGCYAQLGAEALAAIDGIDRVIGTEGKHRLPAMIDSLDKRASVEVVQERILRSAFALPETGLFRETRANLKIQDGCDLFCTFCVIPYSRGRARSRRLGDCLREAHDLAARGHRELVVTGVNIGTYGDNGSDFPGLLAKLEEVPGIDRIRISSIEPMSVGDRVIRLMGRGGKVCPYLHLCLQSGDDRVLQLMRRPYTADDYVSLFKEIYRCVPDVGIGTDVMVGFPGETDAAFERTFELLESLPFYHFHVFAYSEHPRTSSARIEEKVQPEIAKKRSEKVRRLGALKKKSFHDRQVGRSLLVLFESRDEAGRWLGHAPNYARVAVRWKGNLANQIAQVRIGEAFVHEARGQVEEVLS